MRDAISDAISDLDKILRNKRFCQNATCEERASEHEGEKASIRRRLDLLWGEGSCNGPLVGENPFLQGGSPLRNGAGSGARDTISDAISDFDEILRNETLLWERDEHSFGPLTTESRIQSCVCRPSLTNDTTSCKQGAHSFSWRPEYELKGMVLGRNERERRASGVPLLN